MLTKGAIGNLVNRYKAVLAKCNLINTFGSLAVAAALVLGGAGVSGAAEPTLLNDGDSIYINGQVDDEYALASNNVTISSSDTVLRYGTIKLNEGQTLTMTSASGTCNGIIGANSNNGTGNSYILGKGGNLILHNTHIGAGGTGIAAGQHYIDVKNVEIIVDNDGAGIWEGANHEKTTYITDIKAVEDISISSYASAISFTGKGSHEVYLTAGNKVILTSTDDGHAIRGQNNDGDKLIIEAKEVILLSEKRSAIKQHKSETVITADTISISGNTESNTMGHPNTIDIQGGSITLTANTSVTITDGGATNDSTAIGIGSGNLTINSANTSIEGRTSNDGTLNINGGKTTFKDVITGSGTLNANEQAKLNITGENEIGTLGGNGTLLINDTDTTLAVNKLADGATATAKASGALNDALAGDMEAFKKQLKLGASDAGVDVDDLFGGADPGMVADGVDKDGNRTKNEVMDAALQQASITMVSLDKILTNDVRKRLGDIRSDKNTTGVWMRWDGGKLKGDSGLTNNFNTIQIGGDTKAAKNCRIGFAGSFTHGDMDFNRGGGELEGFSFALYGTWMGDNGMFADVVARLGKFSTEMNVEGRKGDMDNRVASLSGEYGWRLPICDQFFVEPQVELAYTYVSSDDLQLGEAHYEFDSVDSLTGRAGVVAGWQLPDERGNVYARASVVQQFMGDAKITGATSGKPVTQEIDGEDTWLEYGIGANVKLTDSTYVWADVERTEGADIEEEWRGTVGVRFSF